MWYVDRSWEQDCLIMVASNNFGIRTQALSLEDLSSKKILVPFTLDQYHRFYWNELTALRSEIYKDSPASLSGSRQNEALACCMIIWLSFMFGGISKTALTEKSAAFNVGLTGVTSLFSPSVESSSFSCLISVDITTLGGLAMPIFSFSRSFAFFRRIFHCHRLGVLPGARCSGCMDLFLHTRIKPLASTSIASLSSAFSSRGEGGGSGSEAEPSSPFSERIRQECHRQACSIMFPVPLTKKVAAPSFWLIAP